MWVVVDQDGAIEGAGDDGLLVAAEVVAELAGLPFLLRTATTSS